MSVLHSLIRFFIKYKYQAIIPIAILEGPIITIICGFLVSIGVLDFGPAFAIVFFGDVISDFAYYLIGRGGRHVLRYFKFVYNSEERLKHLENHFATAPWRTMILAKISYGLGTFFMIASGAAHMKPRKFFEYMLSLNLIRTAILFSFGFYFGKVALRLGPTAIQYYVVSVIIIVPTLYLIYRRKYLKEI